MDLVTIYAASRARLIELAGGLDPATARAPVAPTPQWDVSDVYRHLTGLACDVLAGRLKGAGTPAWTAAHVDSFRGLALPEVCAVWAASAPAFDAALGSIAAMSLRIAGDVWTHEQDVRAAVGLRGLRDDPAATVLAHRYVDLVTARWATFGAAPALEVHIDGDRHRFGSGEPELILRTTSYEFLRSVIGRRSHAQLAAGDWSGAAPERAFTPLSRFELPVADVAD